jgi:(p)ppGpp synthase/HD superfamily hydrolase
MDTHTLDRLPQKGCPPAFPVARSPGARQHPSMPLLEKAIAIATEAHRGKTDKGGHPYILHPLRVMLRVETEDEQIVAVLHDVIEDHGDTWPPERLRQVGFSDQILAALDCVTRRKGETYEQFIERCASHLVARRVKLADLEDNMDLRRLPNITEKDRERLNRYLAARNRLRID